MLRWVLLGLVGVGSSSCHLIVAFDDPPAADAAMAPENCDDGVDNDGDGLVDCQDPDCLVDHECVGEAPTGFSLSYVASTTVSTCPGGGAPSQLLGVNPPACDITGCSCGPPSGGCSVTASLYTSACMGGTTTNVSMVPGMCYPTSGSGTSGSFASAGGSVACAPGGVATTTPAPPAGAVTLCAVSRTSGGCAGGQVCVRRGAPDFTAVCAVASGDQVCPVERPQRSIVGSAINDLRTCACGCSSASSCSTAQVNLYGNGGCGGGSTESVLANAKCKVFQANAGSMRIRPGVAPTACAPTASLSGVFTVTDETTVCCAP